MKNQEDMKEKQGFAAEFFVQFLFLLIFFSGEKFYQKKPNKQKTNPCH